MPNIKFWDNFQFVKFMLGIVLKFVVLSKDPCKYTLKHCKRLQPVFGALWRPIKKDLLHCEAMDFLSRLVEILA